MAAYGPTDVERLLTDASIVRNRAKIEAAIGNARAVCALGPGGLTDLFWSYAPPLHPAPRSLVDVPATSPESVALARALRAAGLRFLGPTTVYAAMQACGVVNDHLADCAVRDSVNGQ